MLCQSSEEYQDSESERKSDVTVLSILILFSEFAGRDRPRQLALNGSTTEYQLKNVAHDTEYVLTLYVLFGSVVGPGISATFKTCEYSISLSTTEYLFSCSFCKVISLIQKVSYQVEI